MLILSTVFEHSLEIFGAVCCVLILAILANIFQQILLKNPHEPPVVFHWLPIIGSTVTYGIDPFKFFFGCQAQVRYISEATRETCEVADAPSMETSSPSSCLVERSPYILDLKATSLSLTAKYRMSTQRTSIRSLPRPSSGKMWSTMCQTQNSWNRRRSVSSVSLSK